MDSVERLVMDEDAEIIEEVEAIVLFLQDRGWFIQETWVSGVAYASWGNYNIKTSSPNHYAYIHVSVGGSELRVFPQKTSSSVDHIFSEELADPQCLSRFGQLLDDLW